MGPWFVEWRSSLLTSLGLGMALGCGGSPAHDPSAGSEQHDGEPLAAGGRPFLVEGRPRTAEVSFLNAGWARAVVPDVTALDTEQRSELALHYTKLGLMEHASVAAFARFVLELLSLSAPAELVRDAQRALGDEIVHAELCFALASSYLGESVSPGALPMDGVVVACSPFEIVRTAILECSVGETIAAVQARLDRDVACDPEVRRVLTRIAEDEARHAELGWRFVHWAIKTRPPARAAALRRELEAIVRGERAHTGGARALAFSALIIPWMSALLAMPKAA